MVETPIPSARRSGPNFRSLSPVGRPWVWSPLAQRPQTPFERFDSAAEVIARDVASFNVWPYSSPTRMAWLCVQRFRYILSHPEQWRTPPIRIKNPQGRWVRLSIAPRTEEGPSTAELQEAAELFRCMIYLLYQYKVTAYRAGLPQSHSFYEALHRWAQMLEQEMRGAPPIEVGNAAKRMLGNLIRHSGVSTADGMLAPFDLGATNKAGVLETQEDGTIKPIPLHEWEKGTQEGRGHAQIPTSPLQDFFANVQGYSQEFFALRGVQKVGLVVSTTVLTAVSLLLLGLLPLGWHSAFPGLTPHMAYPLLKLLQHSGGKDAILSAVIAVIAVALISYLAVAAVNFITNTVQRRSTHVGRMARHVIGGDTQGEKITYQRQWQAIRQKPRPTFNPYAVAAAAAAGVGAGTRLGALAAPPPASMPAKAEATPPRTLPSQQELTPPRGEGERVSAAAAMGSPTAKTGERRASPTGRSRSTSRSTADEEGARMEFDEERDQAPEQRTGRWTRLAFERAMRAQAAAEAKAGPGVVAAAGTGPTVRDWVAGGDPLPPMADERRTPASVMMAPPRGALPRGRGRGNGSVASSGTPALAPGAHL